MNDIKKRLMLQMLDKTHQVKKKLSRLNRDQSGLETVEAIGLLALGVVIILLCYKFVIPWVNSLFSNLKSVA